jgi:hypothetical protein
MMIGSLALVWLTSWESHDTYIRVFLGTSNYADDMSRSLYRWWLVSAGTKSSQTRGR